MTWTRTRTRTDMVTDKDMDMDTDLKLEYFVRYPRGAIVAIAPYETPMTYHSASYNDALSKLVA
jgi:hypothetical protein